MHIQKVTQEMNPPGLFQSRAEEKERRVKESGKENRKKKDSWYYLIGIWVPSPLEKDTSHFYLLT